jgi:hypothetical protein
MPTFASIGHNGEEPMRCRGRHVVAACDHRHTRGRAAQVDPPVHTFSHGIAVPEPVSNGLGLDPAPMLPSP